MAIDISGISYFLPIISFLFVFVIMYAILSRFKILGDSTGINTAVSLIIATIFVTVASTQEYIETVTPWFVVLVVALFFIMILVGFSQLKFEKILTPGFMWVFVVILIVIFLVAGIKVFPALFGDVWDEVTGFVTNEARITGGIILLIVAALAAWVISKK